MMDISALWEDASKIDKISGFGAILGDGIEHELTTVALFIQKKAQENAHTVFDNPTGALADSIQVEEGTGQAVVFTDSPYGARREYGFVGMTDSLGRVGTDEAKPYMLPAVEDSLNDIQNLVSDDISALFGSL